MKRVVSLCLCAAALLLLAACGASAPQTEPLPAPVEAAGAQAVLYPAEKTNFVTCPAFESRADFATLYKEDTGTIVQVSGLAALGLMPLSQSDGRVSVWSSTWRNYHIYLLQNQTLAEGELADCLRENAVFWSENAFTVISQTEEELILRDNTTWGGENLWFVRQFGAHLVAISAERGTMTGATLDPMEIYDELQDTVNRLFAGMQIADGLTGEEMASLLTGQVSIDGSVLAADGQMRSWYCYELCWQGADGQVYTLENLQAEEQDQQQATMGYGTARAAFKSGAEDADMTARLGAPAVAYEDGYLVKAGTDVFRLRVTPAEEYAQ